jgi:hypothetical protein
MSAAEAAEMPRAAANAADAMMLAGFMASLPVGNFNLGQD